MKRPPFQAGRLSERRVPVTVFERISDGPTFAYYTINRVRMVRYSPVEKRDFRLVRYAGGVKRLHEKGSFSSLFPKNSVIAGDLDYEDMLSEGAPNDFIVVDGAKFSSTLWV